MIDFNDKVKSCEEHDVTLQDVTFPREELTVQNTEQETQLRSLQEKYETELSEKEQLVSDKEELLSQIKG